MTRAQAEALIDYIGAVADPHSQPTSVQAFRAAFLATVEPERSPTPNTTTREQGNMVPACKAKAP